MLPLGKPMCQKLSYCSMASLFCSVMCMFDSFRRIGNTDLWVSFTCKTESGTALEALPGIRLHEGKADFQPVSMLHTLAPGVMTTQCLIPLTDDSKYEGIEVFKVKVVHPVFAHLGDPSYVEITVVDPEDGEI